MFINCDNFSIYVNYVKLLSKNVWYKQVFTYTIQNIYMLIYRYVDIILTK